MAGKNRSLPLFLYLLIASWGALALVGQVVLTRQLLVAFYGHETIIALVLAGWLAGVSLGAGIAGRLNLADRLKMWLRIGSWAWVIVLALILILSYQLPALMNMAPGEVPPLERIFLWTILLTIPASFFVGALFVLAGRAVAIAHRPENPDQVVAIHLFPLGGTILWIEAAGSCVGLMFYTFLLVGRVSPLVVVVVFGGLSLALTTAALSEPKVSARAWLQMLFILGITIATWCFGDQVNQRLETRRFHLAFPDYRLVEARETPYQHLALASRAGETALFGNQIYYASWPNPALYQPLALFFLTEAPAFRRVLLAGQGPGAFIHELLGHKIDELVYVALDRAETEMISGHLPREQAKDLTDPRLKLVHDDLRLYLTATGDPAFDLIIINAPDPENARINRLYTREFFEAARNRLNPDGVLVTSISGADNYWSRDLVSYGRTLYRTITAVFPQVVVTPGDRHYFLAGTRPGLVTDDPAELARRYQTLRFESPYLTARSLMQFFPPSGKNYVTSRLSTTGGPEITRLNTDAAPLSYALRLAWWEQMTGSDWTRAVLKWGWNVRSWGWWALGLLSLLAAGLFIRPRPMLVATWTIASTGGVSMALCILLMFMFQNRFGVLYQELGLFSAVFMAGLTMGGLMGRRLAGHGKVQGWWVAISEGLLGLAALATATAATGSWPAVILPLLFFTGGIGGLEFAFLFPLGLSDSARPEPGQVLARLEAADHGGAVLGAVLTGLILAPILGIEVVALILAGIKVVGGLVMLRVKVRVDS